MSLRLLDYISFPSEVSKVKEDYAIRYLVEPWGKPREHTDSISVRPGIQVQSDNYGYADDVFLASILRGEDGKISSILLLDSKGGHKPTVEILEAVKKAIEHHLEHHAQNQP